MKKFQIEISSKIQFIKKVNECLMSILQQNCFNSARSNQTLLLHVSSFILANKGRAFIALCFTPSDVLTNFLDETYLTI